MLVVLHKIDLEENIDRWYLVTIQASLLDRIAVICQYGRRHTTWQQTRVLPVDSMTEAQALAEEIVAAKLKRGYERKLSIPFAPATPALAAAQSEHQTSS